MTEEYSDSSAKVRRPIGISILAILLGVYAAVVLISILYVAAHPEVALRWIANAKDHADDVAVEIVVFSPLRMFLAAALSSGLWGLKDWARKGVIFFAAMGLAKRTAVIVLPSILSNSPNAASHASMIRILLMIGIAVYMIQPSVVKAFEKQSATESEPMIPEEPRQ